MDSNPAQALFLKRLLLRSALSPEEQRAILNLRCEVHPYSSRRDIVRPGDCVQSACLVSRGLVARYDQMLDGRRQLTSFYIVGDMCDLHSVVAPKASWSITAISDATVLKISHQQLQTLCIEYPRIALAFWRDGTVDTSVFAKWIANLGAKSAKARLAHLFCEIGLRSESAGLGTRTDFEFAATQAQLGEAAGLTAVHVNRVLQELRAEGLLSFKLGRVHLTDWDRMTCAGEFTASYLMLDLPPQKVGPLGYPIRARLPGA